MMFDLFKFLDDFSAPMRRSLGVAGDAVQKPFRQPAQTPKPGQRPQQRPQTQPGAIRQHQPQQQQTPGGLNTPSIQKFDYTQQAVKQPAVTPKINQPKHWAQTGFEAAEEFVRKGADGRNFGDNALSMVAGNAAKLLNTANEGVIQPIRGLASGKSEAEVKKEMDQRLFSNKGGLLGEGTFFPTKERYNEVMSNPAEFGKGFTGAGVATATEVAPVMRGTSLLLKPGLSTKSRIIRGAGEGIGYGAAGTAGTQLIGTGELDAKGIATGALVGGVMGGGIPAVGGGIKKGKQAFQDDLRKPVVQAAEQASGLPKLNVLNDNEAYTLSDYADIAMKRQVVSNAERNKVVMQARNAAKTAGFDVTNMTPREADMTIANYLQARDTFKSTYKLAERQMMQGGYIGGPQATGFKQAQQQGRVFDGVDGKPRFEVSDRDAMLFHNVNLDDNFRSGKLGDVLDHPELFKDYPELKDVIVKRNDELFSPGQASQENASYHNGTITINPRILPRKGEDTSNTLSTILHETQHAIQKKEGFAKGGAPNRARIEASIRKKMEELKTKPGENMMAPEVQARTAEYSKLERVLGNKGNLDKKAIAEYRRFAGEAEARAVAARRNMTDEERYVGAKDTSYRDGHQIVDGKTLDKIDDLDARIASIKGRYGLTNSDYTDIAKLKKVVGNPDADVKIYRAAPKNELNGGDWVTTNKSYAQSIAKENGGKVHEFTVKSKDLKQPDNLNDLPSRARFSAFSYDVQAKPRSTFYDSLDVPKKDLIVRNEGGVAMSIDSKKIDDLKYEIQQNKDFLSQRNLNPNVRRYTEKKIASLTAQLNGATSAPKQKQLGNYITPTNRQKATQVAQTADQQVPEAMPVAQKSTQGRQVLPDQPTYGQNRASGLEGKNLEATTQQRPSSDLSVKSPAKEVEISQSSNSKIQQKPKIVKEQRRAIDEGAGATYGLRDSFDAADNVPNELKDSLGAFGNTRTVKTNKELWSDAQNRMQDPADAMKFFTETNSDEAVATGYALINKYMKAGQTKEAGDIAMTMAERALESGRQTQAYAMMKKLTPEGSIAYVARKVGKYLDKNPNKANKLNWDDKVQADLYKMAGDISTMPEGRARNLKIGEMQMKIDNIFPSSLADKAITVWKAGLLTSLRTQERNLVGNFINGAGEQVSTLPGSLADKIMSLRTKQRTLVASHGEGLGSGAKYGGEIASDQLRTGIDVTDSNLKMNINHITWGDNAVEKTLKGYTEAVFRTLGASDKVFKEAARKSSLYNQALASAKSKKLNGQALDEYVKKFINNPTAKVRDLADIDASRATFTHDNVLGDLVKKGKQSLRSSGTVPAAVGDIIVPFTQVPTGVASQLYAYSPVKLVKSMYDIGKVLTTGNKELQRSAAQGFGRSVVGTSVIGAGAYLMAKGLMTGQPEDDAEKAQWEAQGKMPNSIKVGDRWYQLGSIGPQTILLLAGGHAMRDSKEGRNPLVTMGGNLAKDFKDQTFLKGMSSALEAIDDPKRYASSFMESLATSIVPNIVKDVAKTVDSSVREARGVGDRFKQSIPGISQSLPERLDSYGQPLKNRGAGAMFDLFNSSKEKDVPEARYVDALRESVGTADHIPTKADRTITINGESRKLNSQELSDYQRYIGTKGKEFIAKSKESPEFNKLSDEEKANNLDQGLKNINSAAKIVLFGHNADSANKSVKSIVGTGNVEVRTKLADSSSLTDDIPSNISTLAANLLREADSADRTDEWKAKPTSNKEVSNSLKQWLPNKVDMPPINNETALAWAKYEKDFAGGKISKLEAQDKKKAILRDAFNSQLNKDERKLYSLSKERLQGAIDNKLINSENIEKALKVEQQMYEAGLLAKRPLAQKLGLTTSTSKYARGGTGKGRGRKAGGGSKAKGSTFAGGPQTDYAAANQTLARLLGTTRKGFTARQVATAPKLQNRAKL